MRLRKGPYIGVRFFEPCFELFAVYLLGIVLDTVDFSGAVPSFLNNKHAGAPFQGRLADIVSSDRKGGFGGFGCRRCRMETEQRGNQQERQGYCY